MDKKNKIIFGRLSEFITEKTPWGEKSILFSDWGDLNLTGMFLTLHDELNYGSFTGDDRESIILVEEGRGMIRYRTQEVDFKKGYAVKIFPEQNPLIIPETKVSLTCIQKPVKSQEMVIYLNKPEEILVVNPEQVPSMVYEYETLAQEIFTCDYENGLGLIRFIFPIDRIPLHQHPFAGRMIRTIAGRGYTYVEPEKFKMDTDSFALFPKGVTHTNGPDPGHIYAVWAVQLPWIESMIDENDIAGSEAFVRYLGPKVPRELWKTKAEFLTAIKRLSGNKYE
jgi:mannose-6-phosphate isomerase-like protein (cupin superfamily)